MRPDKNRRITLTLWILLLVMAGAFAFILKNQQETDSAVLPTPAAHGGGMVSADAALPNTPTASELLAQITVGCNIGSSFDSCPTTGRNDGSHDTSYYETLWGNPVITRELVNTVAVSGFNAIRLPVTWYYNTYYENGRLVIREDWLARVTEVIDYALDRNVYVVLDSHHDDSIIWADMADISEVSGNLSDLWSQLSEHFRDYGSHLIFESFNGISTRHNDWQFSESSAEATNILNQVFVDTVRASGGGNAERVLICGTYLSETTDSVLESFVLPTDGTKDRLAVSVHNYDSSYNQDVVSLFERLQRFSKKIGAPVTITEFGTKDSFIPTEYRPNHAGNYIAWANEYDIRCFWWDDGGAYKLFDRYNNVVVREDIVESLMNPAKFETKKISTTVFDSIASYSYASISSRTGGLVDFPSGALTLNPGKQGLPVTTGYGYRIRLLTEGRGDGLRISGLGFYDAHQNLVEYRTISDAVSYDIAPSGNAAFMRITFYNPWETRTLGEYISYFESGELSLEITEYVK